MAWLVVFEWNGKKPPTTFYNRMRDQFGLKVRTDKTDNDNVLRARAEAGYGRSIDTIADDSLSVVIQEACVMTPSESLARQIYRYGEERGAKSAMFETTAMKVSTTVEDAKIYNRIEAAAGKRGRPNASEKITRTVTCYEQCSTFEVPESRYAVVCPDCHGTRIYAREGEMKSYSIPAGDVLEAWKRHRFATGRYEVASVGDPGTPEPPKVVTPSVRMEEMILNKVISSKDAEKIRKMSRPLAFKYLDAIFCSRYQIPEAIRKEQRVKVVARLLEKGIGFDKFHFLETENYDLLDAAGIIDAAIVASDFISGL